MTRRPGWLLALAFAAAVAGGAAADAATTLRITMQLPLTAPLGQNLVDFKERVEAASGGDIRVEIYPASQLYTDREVPVAVATGQIEMGVAFLPRFAGLIPAVEVFSVPFLLNDDALVRAATAPNSPVRGPLDEAILGRGARVLWWQPYGFSLILTRDRPVRVPDDLRGLRIRTFGKAYESLVRAAGGAATNVTASAQYLAYERGTVDGGMTGLMTVKDRKLWQVLDHLTLANLTPIEAVVLINERAWQRLSEDHRTIVAEAAVAVEAELRDKVVALQDEALAEARANGMNIVELDDADLAAWRAVTADLAAEFVADAGPLGAQVLEAAEALRARLAAR